METRTAPLVVGAMAVAAEAPTLIVVLAALVEQARNGKLVPRAALEEALAAVPMVLLAKEVPAVYTAAAEEEEKVAKAAARRALL